MKHRYPSEQLEVEVTGLSEKGLGLAEYRFPDTELGKGRKLKLQIPKALPGDKLLVTVPNARGRRRATRTYDRIIEPSPSRNGGYELNGPQVGGAPLEYMNYPDQLAYKGELTQEFLADQGFDPSLVGEVWGMDDPYHYRNKLELSFSIDGDLGFFVQGDQYQIVDWQENILAPEIFMTLKEEVQSWQKAWGLAGYEKQSKQGLLRQLLLRQGQQSGEVMVAIFAQEDAENLDSDAIQDLIQRLQAYPEIKSLMWIKNTAIADRMGADKVEVLAGRDYIRDELAGFNYRLYFDTFFQPNPTQAQKMIDLACDWAELDEDSLVIDLFCGVGSFSLPLAKRAKALVGIEIVEQSIESAKRNARDNGITNAHFIARDARHGLAEIEEEWGQADLLLLDPPRNGAGGKIMRRIGRMGLDKIIYVSCNPKSLAADLVWLREFGYEVIKFQLIDQFPHTQHVEAVVLLEKR
ncbi:MULTISPECIES: 23S rRNA (uracil(1939)-C(5))-methyltransferase RlmD [Aerococcus]|uniref:23S rRNA (Uracil(1939)-C(5))-methyltransferase RlmD n=1 Tax=Aerococcus tenax TaxID=3078812 RepID=A0A5N1BU07_9LACT|nr:23S rRNA (uracil(1939)-C(5))-methyltransferase RlmD [Aerococcus urinae]KAA9241003.1 23S rRNA (uracil(1939)-C(5))-methyltransferase RlmD [Aerococcus urinae]MDK6370493.1 23S rRNA (uracil(1939)-C(5))-methyltransferase RlmD [Aerococcus urinae]MDK6596835.1 23S rRNA (uracil(1939)-C(5))-methyltransferase RlmD [Aerococcus urinae]MDK7302298.1 23S rRNA (uracil(1939)-C(5))-methyltransferase RlmD [Aerococcus urinae]MDK7800749.1 23S rRNA (uracil(1939)-C(5))-methyltransferase RlmD [Aerococcus urinae]